MEINEDSYVIQPNVISRAIYIMPTMVRRLIHFAILNVQITRPDDMYITIPLHDLALQFGFTKTKRYNQIKAAIDIATKQVLRFEKDDGVITEWIPWLTYCNLNLKTNILSLQVNPHLHGFVLSYRQNEGFTILLTADLLKLEGRYAYRWFEIIVSRSGHADHEGHFFVRCTFDDVKQRFVIDKNKYKSLKDFKQNIINKPIEEINGKYLGYKIYIKYVCKGKKVTDLILQCVYAERKNGKKPIAYYISRYRKEYRDCYNEAKKSLEVRQYRNRKSYDLACTHKAIELLKERLPNE